VGEVVAAAAAAQLHGAILRNFPQGYDTAVGERGLRLSGGEKARVAIARALLKGAPILLADEMTAALDTATESSVMDSLQDTARGGGGGGGGGGSASSGAPATVLIVAHRLSTLRRADFIAVVDAGAVVEQGTHAQLLGRNGLYARLWRQQELELEERKGAAGGAP